MNSNCTPGVSVVTRLCFVWSLLMLNVASGRDFGNFRNAAKEQCESYVNSTVSHALQAWPRITLQDVEKSTFASGFRVQRIQGEWWVSGFQAPSTFNREATMKLILFGLAVQHNRGEIKDGLDFFIDVSDGNYKSGPVLSFCSLKGQSITIPDYSLLSWPDAKHSKTFYGLYRSLPAVGREPKLYSDKAVFAGNMFENRKALVKGFSPQFAEITDSHQKGVDWNHRRNAMELRDMCRHQYLLHLPGDNFLKNRNGDIVMPYEEWYYSLLKPWTHYVPAYNGSDLNQKVKYLIANPNLTQQIARNGAQFAAEMFHPKCVHRYWLALLEQYAARMTYKTKVPEKGSALLTNLLIKDVHSMEEIRQPKKNWREWWNHQTYIADE